MARRRRKEADQSRAQMRGGTRASPEKKRTRKQTKTEGMINSQELKEADTYEVEADLVKDAVDRAVVVGREDPGPVGSDGHEDVGFLGANGVMLGVERAHDVLGEARGRRSSSYHVEKRGGDRRAR